MDNSHYQKVNKKELLRARKEIQVELDWIKKAKLTHFKNYKQILVYYNSNENQLVKINEESIGINGKYQSLTPIMRYRNPDNREDLSAAYPPYLLKFALNILLEIGQAWRLRIDQLGISDSVSLAITTLLKTLEHKEEMIRQGAYAFIDGPHSTGIAFDIDACGYYIDGISCRPPRENEQKAIASLSGSNGHNKIQKVDYRLFQPEVLIELKKVLEEFQIQNKIHFIHENEQNPNNSVFHICANPCL